MQLLPAIGVIMVALLATGLAPAANNVSKPQRIVSMNLCTDELVLRLADRGNISSVTWQARDRDNSNVADLARDVPINHGLAEEILPLNPDLVLAGIYTARSEEHTSELQSRPHLVCRLLLEKKKPRSKPTSVLNTQITSATNI